MSFKKWYDKNYKKLLVLPAIVLTLSLLYIGFFYFQNGDIIKKDVSLTGGTTIAIQTQASPQKLKDFISQNLTDFEVKAISDNSGKQLELVVTVGTSGAEKLQKILENFLGEKLTSENSSKETTSASLSKDFYKQLIAAMLLAFFWMAGVVFIIFAKGKKIKTWAIILNLLFGFFMGKLFFSINKYLSAIILIGFASGIIYIYIKNSVPSFAVMLSAFADIIMTLTMVDIVGMKISTAGIVSFLMLIGYSVDTDVLLTTRLLKKKEETDKALFGAFKTGTTMTTTSIIAIAVALIIVHPFQSVLNQIFTILLIGLTFDLFNTWVTNASMIKWYAEIRG